MNLARISSRSPRWLATAGAALVLFSFGAWYGQAANAQDAKQDPVELQRKMMAAAVPGPQHELLAKYEGDFTLEIKMWPHSGADEPLVSESTGKNQMVLGGRFLQCTSSGTFFGMTMETLSMVGFDRRHEEFTTVGFDTAGTYWVSGQGPYDEATKTTTMSGTDVDPLSNMTQVYDHVVTFVDDDTYTWDVVFHNKELAPDGPFTMVKIKATRNK